MSDSLPIVIVGAGMAGLSCALRLKESGRKVLVLEGANRVGGRVRTDEVNGFRIDRGFQVYLDAYPTAGALLEHAALDLKPFAPGALVWMDGKLHRLMDVFRCPSALLETALSPVGTAMDKLRVGKFRARMKWRSLQQIGASEELSTLEFLRREGFSEGMIDAFFRSFYGGIFLERELQTSSRMFQFTFKMFAEGRAALPAQGMQRIPEQLAARLDEGDLRLGSRVEEVTLNSVRLSGGEEIPAQSVVVATDASVVSQLIPSLAAEMPSWRSEVSFAFAARAFPLQEPLIALNGTGQGLVNNVCNLSAVSSEYAPKGKDLVMATVLGDQELEGLEEQVRDEIGQWFDCETSSWELLRSDRIARALPCQVPGGKRSGFLRSDEGIWVAGDHCQSASIEGAIVSGRKTADTLIAGL